MRTYSRKRPEHKELENVMNLCRLCLEKPDEAVPIYTDDDSSLYSSLALRIMLCVGLEMAKEDSLSNFICLECHKEIEKYYTFRKKCEMSYQRLKSHIQAVKAKEYRAQQNLTFSINSDGSIQLKDNNNMLLDDEEPLVKLTKILNDEGKISNTEVLQMLSKTSRNEMTKVQNTGASSQILIEKAQEYPDPPNLIPAAIKPGPQGKEIPPPLEENPPDPEISEFLSTMLTELGILTQHGDGVVELDPSMSPTLELETRDGNNIIFELVEESEEVVTEKTSVQELQQSDSMQTSISEIEDQVLRKRSIAGGGGRARAAACESCGRVLASRGALARHRRSVHARARPHACHACGKTFAQKEVLARHLFVHDEKRPFACDKCPKSFTQRSSLHAHAHSHRPERALTLFPCAHCDKMFFYASGLSRHLLQHSNKQFICGECGRTFADKSSLRRHEKNMRHRADKTNASDSAAATADTG